MTLYLSLLPKSFKREIRFINIQQDTLTFTGTERTMDTRELTCVCLERDALFMQEIVKLYPFSNKGRMALLGSL